MRLNDLFFAKSAKPQRRRWAQLLSRVFGIDLERCPCGGKLAVIAAITASLPPQGQRSRSIPNTRDRSCAQRLRWGLALLAKNKSFKRITFTHCTHRKHGVSFAAMVIP